MMLPLKMTVLATCLLAAGCGTRVETGDNLAKSQAQAASSDAQPADPVVPPGAEDGTAPATGASPGAVNSGGAAPQAGGGAAPAGAALTCFGPAPSLPADIQTFCDQIDPTMKATFQTAVGTICTGRKLVNLLLTPCSWDGDGPSTPFRRVLNSTALDDTTTTDFSFFGAYAVTTALTLEAEQTLILLELSDPAAYAQTYLSIVNSRIYDITPRSDGGYDYTVDFASSSATVTFRATARPQKFTDNLTVIYDYAIGDEVLLKTHHFLRLMLREGTGTRMIAVDEKVVSDAGNHAVAYQDLTSVLQQRHERDYVNSTR